MLIQQNLRYYWRSNLAVIAGVAIAVAVLAGALVVGDSVRASLRDLVIKRLGHTDIAIISGGFFRESLADEIRAHQSFVAPFEATCPLIAMNGFVRDQSSGRQASGVQVYGIDERFWRFHEHAAPAFSSESDAFISDALATDLGMAAGGAILARVETRAAIPADSLHGRKEDVGRTIRLTVQRILSPEDLGEFSLGPQQGPVRAIFMPLRRLQTALARRNAINAILISSRDSSPDSRAAASPLIERIVRESARLEDLGLTVRKVSDGSLAVESSSAIVSDGVAAAVRSTAARLGLKVTPVLSYLANAIRLDGREIPYSLVTAVDLDEIKANLPAVRSERPPFPVLLNEWAARDLGAHEGSTISLDYYIWEEQGRLETRTAAFDVAGVVPIEGAAADRDLTPHYPGITDSNRLSDWDPPFPIDLKKVRAVDEEYWHQYRTTPKAFVPLEAGQTLWKSPHGSVTSLRVRAVGDTAAPIDVESFAASLRDALDPLGMGLSVVVVRASDLNASQGATDFGEYFTYFSTFLVASALLLAALFFKLGVEQRVGEIGLLQAVGYDERHIRKLFFSEAVLLVTIGSLIGVLGATAYGELMMTGLRTWWRGAVGTTSLTLHLSAMSLIAGSAGCFIAALACLWWTLRSLRALSPRGLLSGSLILNPPSPRAGSARSRIAFGTFLMCVATAIGLIVASSRNLIDRTGGFFGAGSLLLIGLLTLTSLRLRTARRTTITGHGWRPVLSLGLRNATSRPGRSLLCIALIASATFVIVALEAFRRDDTRTSHDRRSGTGGYQLIAESLLPIVQDIDSRQGRDSLGLPSEANDLLDHTRISRFRLRPGDDASCLNLYKPANPRILGATPAFVREGRFRFQSSIAATPPERQNPWLFLERQLPDGAVPVIADANSLTYVLHLGLGEDLVLPGASDHPIRLRVVGALADSIFQSELLMSDANFRALFPRQEGYRLFLVETPDASAASATTSTSAFRTLDSQVSELLESHLGDYGLDVNSTAERLAAFHRVEYTYISTFQMLGGLGVLVGTFGLAAVLLRNVLERRRELAALGVVGFRSRHFSLMVVAENVLLLVAGLVIGTVSALLAIAPVLLERGTGLPVASLGVLLAGILASGLLASLLATAAVLRSPVIPALRAE